MSHGDEGSQRTEKGGGDGQHLAAATTTGSRR